MSFLRSITFFNFLLISSELFSQTVFFSGGNICKSEPYKLVFNDEFDGDSLDSIKWMNYFPYTPDGSDQCEFCRTHGEGGQIFTDTNLSIGNGTLKLIAKRQNATWFSATRDFTSAIIRSRWDYKYMYGRFETRCKIPVGKGLLSAFWMFGGTDDGIATEIDGFEINGAEPNHHGMGVIKYHETEFYAKHDCYFEGNNLEDGFHIFTVDWDPFFVCFSVDNEQIFVTSRFYTIGGTQVTWCCTEPAVYNTLPAFPSSNDDYLNIILSLAIGIDENSPDENTHFPAEFEIDYIRVYQRDTLANPDYTCEVLLYPNPASDKLKVKKSNMTLLRIENMLGEILFSETLHADEAEIEVRNFRQGIYFVEVQSEDGTFAAKFVKE